MKRLVLGSLYSLIFLFVGCNDILDIQPQQSISSDKAMSTSDDVKRVLGGAYDNLGGSNVFGGHIYNMPDVMGAGSDAKFSGTRPPLLEVHEHKINTTNSYNQDTWLGSYKAINNANQVLLALDIVDKTERNKVEGEAKFIRAIIYYQLVNLYGRNYNDGEPSQNLGVPLKLEPTKTIGEEQVIARNSVIEVYNQVLKDLKDAKSMLKEHAPSYIYATEYAAGAFLARVYLQMGKYEKARDEANEVIEKGPYSLVENYANVFNNSNKNSSEDIFAIQISEQHGSNDFYATYRAADEGGDRGRTVTVTQQHIDRYESEDQRLQLFYKDESNYYVGKYKNQYANANVIRLAEMYLIRAECNQRLGTAVGAKPVQDVNTIRHRAGLKDAPSVTLNNILTQRYLELAFEGHFLSDLKRLKGSTAGTAWDSPELIFPIPQREIDTNSELKQNEGYGS